MLYLSEKTIYCMQLKLRGKNLSNTLRYGIANNNLKTVKIYDYKYSNSRKKSYKYIRSYRKIEKAENLQSNTSREDTTCEGKTQSNMGNKPNKYNNTKEEGKLKYVHVIPHEYCPENFVILEIVPQSIDKNNNKVVPETTASRRVTGDRKPKVTRNTKPKWLTNNISKGRILYNKVLKTLQVQKILKAKTSPLWEMYKNRRRLMTYDER